MALLKFNKGLFASLPTTNTEGSVYITTDTKEMYVDVTADKRIAISKIVVADSVDANGILTVDGSRILKYSDNLLYYVKGEDNLRRCATTEITEEVTSVVWTKIGDLTELTDALGKLGVRLIAVEKEIYGEGEGDAHTPGLKENLQDLTTAVSGINASNINTTKSFKVTKAVGNYEVGEEIGVHDIQKIIIDMLCEDVKPVRDTKNLASASLSLKNAKAYEVGYEFTPSFLFNTNGGKYIANGVSQDANVTYNSWNVKETSRPDNGALGSSTSSSGSFAKFTVTDNTSYQLSGWCKSTDGDIPKTYLGENYDEDGTKKVRFMATDWGTESSPLTSGKVTGYRAMFYGYFDHIEITDPSKITSAQVRALSGAINTNTEASPKWETKTGPQTALPSGKKEIKTNKMQQMFFAAPKGKVVYTLKDDGVTVNTGISVTNSANGAPQTIKHTQANVEGLNHYTATAYDIFYVSNNGAESGETIFDVAITLA